MPSLPSSMASLLALAGLASAMAFPQHRAHKRSNDLIPIRHFASDDTATIRSAGSATTLQPIRPGRSSKGDGRSRQSAFKLRDEDSLYWGGADGTVAELRVDMPGETEAVVDIEYFDDLIESMQCPQNGTGDVVIDFLDHADLSAAGEIWDWVNQHPDHSFLLMVGAGDCGWNQDRILYNIRGLDFTESSKIATLHGQPIDWRTALHSYELNIGKAAKQNGTSRGFFDDIGDFFGGEYNPSLSFPFEHDISGESISFSIDGVQFSGTCAECSTAGSFDVQAKFHVSWFELKEAYVELSTPGIDATAVIDVTVKGDLTDTLLQQSLPIFKASPAGISIPGIVTIGPTVSIALNAGVSAIKGSVTLTLGGTATIPPSNSRLDFLNEDGTGSEGWEPHFESVPLEADILVEATASVALNAAVGLEVSALETGFAAELGADLPKLSAGLQALHSTSCSACDQFATAVQGSITLGTAIKVALKKKIAGTMSDLWSKTLWEASLPPLASFCEAVGPQDSCVGNGTWVGQRL